MIAPLLPGQPKRGRNRHVCLKRVISGIFHLLQNGCAWAKDGVGYDAGKKVKGRKRHTLVDTMGLMLRCDIHSAGTQDQRLA